jgi:2,3-bisphosphoglycerate-dependent phosphoglycerate mutase
MTHWQKALIIKRIKFMKTIWLIRHAQSTSNAGAAAQDPASIPLSPVGELQAQTFISQIQKQATALEADPVSIHVSLFGRTLQTAQPCITVYPNASVSVGPHQEFTYLAPAACEGLTSQERSHMAQAYWQAAQPEAVHGENAESFTSLMLRVQRFEVSLGALTHGWHLVFGHGQFFWAYALHRCQPFPFSHNSSISGSDWMKRFRQSEVAAPIANIEHIELRQYAAQEWFSASQAREFLGDDPELLVQLQNEYRQQLPKHIEALRHSWWHLDAKAMAVTLHAVRPMTEILCNAWLLGQFDHLHNALHASVSVSELPLSAIWALGSLLSAWQTLVESENL